MLLIAVGNYDPLASEARLAIEHGTCGSWKAVRRMIAADLPGCASLAELDQAIESLVVSRPQWPDDVAREVQQYLLDLVGRLPSLESSLQAAIRDTHRQIQTEVDQLTHAIRRLEAEKFFLLRWFNQWRRVPPLRQRLAWLDGAPNRAAQPHAAALASTRQELARVRSNPQAEADHRVGQREQRLARLQGVQKSGEHAGASAECQMARILVRGLPDEFHVFHDVNVEADRWIWDGQQEHRKSAQIDHVVVGPGGVFVIETKWWSKAFAAGGGYYDPYRQVKWAGKLLHFALSDACGQKIRVREVLATTGSLPNKPADSFAKVCTPDSVCGYVRYFKPELTAAILTTAQSLLDRLC